MQNEVGYVWGGGCSDRAEWKQRDGFRGYGRVSGRSSGGWAKRQRSLRETRSALGGVCEKAGGREDSWASGN